MDGKEYRFAVLIDADNASYKTIGKVLDQVRMLGAIYIKRAYGDFASQQLSPWRDVSNELALMPVQQFAFTAGKNSTDSRMIIDAMDILHGGMVNAFCIVSSDCDFTGLAKRLKEGGVFVFGAGRADTPASFVNSCDRFWKVDGETAPKGPAEKQISSVETMLAAKSGAKCVPMGKESQESAIQALPRGGAVDVNAKDVADFACEAINAAESQSLLLSRLMTVVYSKFPSFDPKDYGCKKAVDFFRKQSCFKVSGEQSAISVSVK